MLTKKQYILPLIILSGFIIYLATISTPDSNPPIAKADTTAPERIISINPAATEIIYKLNCEEKLIAVSDFCNYPPPARKKPTVGGAINPNFERISFLRPDLIIVQGQPDDITGFCDRKNIEYININLRTIEEIYDEIILLGEKLSAPLKAKALGKNIKNELAGIKNKVASAEKKKVFFSLYRTPGSLAGITTVGPDTFLSQLLNIAGGTNIFNDLNQDYPVISKETLLKRQPDIIIEPFSDASQKTAPPPRILKDWKKLTSLNAVKNNNLHTVNADLILKPGPRVAEAAHNLARLIHPELFDE